jgi:hypothetical protein
MVRRSLQAALFALACSSVVVSTSPGLAGPSGLPWPSGWGCWDPQFDSFRGRASDAYVMFLGRSDRTSVVNSMRSRYIGKFKDLPGKLVLSFPMLTNDISGRFAQCAAGDYDQYVRDAANALKGHGLGDTIVRLGWEPNGNFPWSVGGDRWDRRGDYLQCFRRQVDIFRSIIPNVQIEWDNRRRGAIRGPVQAIYPGNDYVDIIGVMLYDRWDIHTNEAEWDEQYMERDKYGGLRGIGTYLEFARQNGKKFSVPEWAVSNNDNDPSSFDNPFFVRRMYQFFDENASDIAFEGYFNCGAKTSGYTLTPETINPRAAAAYAEAWRDGAPEPEPEPVRYQAENATRSGAKVSKEHSGYTGTGFVDYENRVGPYIEWRVTASKAGPADLTFRYANGSGSNRPVSVTVNGITVSSSYVFGPTGAWTNWSTKTLSTNLKAGTNTVRARSTGSSGGPNMDRLDLLVK